ncbi:cAMP-binding domain of CRP or a regulatory subunit of cAMP-dependent protein kinases [Sphingomonas gellani]|uniref:cAMP-binding domain of CRP or a regulatory subunit of cAMP-dependent protein kinases n=1 Tax=Sphingomonas gellani TaxID=1166340 RepID=A0A1H8AIJ4_9SPHN|nr:Crp/Fnr family transcriptional regulator [Sphingomonas gellani]SEM70441.1 cAMP-binding domain of CRP or a regulatory subunit of cAMP-dependent protein kinases [Sphingomonas gellani]
MRKSALVQRLEQYATLSAGERDALDWAERRETRVPAGERLLGRGENSDTLYVVQLGWFHAAIRLPTGARQILRFHFPGDLMGTSSIAWAQAVHDFTAVSDAIVSELSKVNLGRIFREQPRLAGLLYAMSAAENVALSDRLTSVGRMDSLQRLSTLILDVLARLRVTAGGVIDSFDFPLTQTDIGDTVGLTKVHVSRTLGKMEDLGLIQRNGKRVRVLDEARMIADTGFVDRYKEIESSWLAPPPT